MKFDTSDYSDELLNLYNFPKANKKRLGFFKDELNGRPKMYSFKTSNSNDSSEKTVKKSKGVKRSAIDQLTFNSFKKCLFSEEEVVGSMSMIRSKNHLLSTIKCNVQ